MNSICISKLIIPGSLVSFKLFKQSSWSLNIVTQCSEDSINLPLTPDIMKGCIFTDSCVDIKYNNEYFEYIITGTISKIELSGSPYIKVKIHGIVESINHRIFQRLDVCLPATLCSGNNSYFCKVSNLSLGGAAFLLNKEIPIKTSCEINILLEDNSTIYAKGELLRIYKDNSIYTYSMMFTFMEEENSNHLYSYLYSLENSYDLLRDKYL